MIENARALFVLALALATAAAADPASDEDKNVWMDEDGTVIVVEDDQPAVFLAEDDGEAEDGDMHGFRMMMADGDGAYLGVTLGEVDDESAKEAGIAEGKGALIRTVFDDTPAEAAGLEAGDIVVRFEGKPVESVDDLIEQVRSREPGDQVQLEVKRDGDKKQFKIKLAEREKRISIEGNPSFQHMGRLKGLSRLHAPELLALGAGEGPGRGLLGVEIRDLSEDLAEYFPGAKEGALILEVHEDTPAAQAGLKAGDVILKLGDEQVADADDLRQAVREARGDKGVSIEYLRKGEMKSAQVDLADAGERIDDRIIERVRISDDDLEAKMKRLEEKLEKLEQKLEDRK